MQRVLPIYLAVDTSTSMAAGRLEAVQEAIILLAEELLVSPLLGETVRFSVVGFSDDARLVLPLTDLTEIRSLPRMSAGGTTNFGPLFRYLSKVIERDMLGLQAHDTVPYRPAVFMVVDGLPADSGWERLFLDFERRSRANFVVIALELGSADADKLRKQLRPLTLYAWDDLPADVLAERIFHVIERFATSLSRSVVLSTERGSELVLPPLDGFMPDDVL